MSAYQHLHHTLHIGIDMIDSIRFRVDNYNSSSSRNQKTLEISPPAGRRHAPKLKDAEREIETKKGIRRCINETPSCAIPRRSMYINGVELVDEEAFRCP